MLGQTPRPPDAEAPAGDRRGAGRRQQRPAPRPRPALVGGEHPTTERVQPQQQVADRRRHDHRGHCGVGDGLPPQRHDVGDRLDLLDLRNGAAGLAEHHHAELDPHADQHQGRPPQPADLEQPPQRQTIEQVAGLEGLQDAGPGRRDRRIEPQGLAEVLQRPRRVAGVDVCPADAGVGDGVFRVAGERLPQAVERLIPPAEGEQRLGPQVQGVDVLRVEPQGGLGALEGRLPIAGVTLNQAGQPMVLRVVGVQPDGLGHGGAGLGQTPGVVQDRRQRVMSRFVLRVGRHRGTGLALGGGDLAALGQAKGQLHVRRHAVGVLGRRGAELALRQVAPARPDQHHSAQQVLVHEVPAGVTSSGT